MLTIFFGKYGNIRCQKILMNNLSYSSLLEFGYTYMHQLGKGGFVTNILL
jgi:hypothetical protein